MQGQPIAISTTTPVSTTASIADGEFILSYENFVKFINYYKTELEQTTKQEEICDQFRKVLARYSINSDADFIEYLYSNLNNKNDQFSHIMSFIISLVNTLQSQLQSQLKQVNNIDIFTNNTMITKFIFKLDSYLTQFKSFIIITDKIPGDLYNNKIINKIYELYLKANFNPIYKDVEIKQFTTEENTILKTIMVNHDLDSLHIMNLIELLIKIEYHTITSELHAQLYNKIEQMIIYKFKIKSLFETVTNIMSDCSLDKFKTPDIMYGKIASQITQSLLINYNITNNCISFISNANQIKYNQMKDNHGSEMTHIIYLLLYIYYTYCNKHRCSPYNLTLSNYIKSVISWTKDSINTNITDINPYNYMISAFNSEIGKQLLQ